MPCATEPCTTARNNEQWKFKRDRGSNTLPPLHTPGHSPGHVAYDHKKDRVLIGGDLFTSKKGQLRTPIPMFTADMKQAVKSGAIVKELKPAIVSLCHGNDVKEPHKQIEDYMNSFL